jgi:hypothetical protein
MKTVAIFLILCTALVACSETPDSMAPLQEKTTIPKPKKKEPVTESDTITKLQPNGLTSSEIKQREQDIQLLKQNGKLTHFAYPNMSFCGGDLNGYYSGKELVSILSTFGGEFGYSSRYIDWKNNQPVKIVYREHFADWEKYNIKYPDEKDIDENNMFYTDTLYTIELGKTWKFRKSAGRKTVSTIIDSALVNQLINCAFSMKKELETTKIRIK